MVCGIQLETAEGTQNFSWDGLRSDGTQAESDTYDIEAVGHRARRDRLASR